MKSISAISICILFITTSSVFTFPTTKEGIVQGILNEFMSKPTKDLFKVFHFIFDKSTEYELDSQEGIRRYKNFRQNLKEIKEHNAKGLSWTEGINQFSDLTIEEFSEKYLLNEDQIKNEKKNLRSISLDDFNDEQDEILAPKNGETLASFTHVPYQLPPRDQGNCGSCWAFSCAAATETNFAKEFNLEPFYLSPQQLIDCSTKNRGCNGGDGNRAFDYIRFKGGLVKEEDYVYKAKNQVCKIPANANRFLITDYDCVAIIPLAKWHALVAQGAAYVVVDAKPIMRYSGGIMRFSQSATKCLSHNHAVTASGFATDANGEQYIIVKNSWGTRWGDKGYINAYYEKQNDTCFMTIYACRPIPQENDRLRRIKK